MNDSTFLVFCPTCRSKVAAQITGRAAREVFEPEHMTEPLVERVMIGNCPSCDNILVASQEVIKTTDGPEYEHVWSPPERIFPVGRNTFENSFLPRTVKESLSEASGCMEAGRAIAACAMFGRALEAICRDQILKTTRASENGDSGTKPTREVMLGAGLAELHRLKIIDDRLYEWSKQLNIVRNLAAHPDADFEITHEDADDLETFVVAITEYIYDLAERYQRFKARIDRRRKPVSTENAASS